MTRSRSALIHIGASDLQMSSIELARQMGFYVVVTDINSDAPGCAIADRFELVSGTDVEAVVALAQEVSIQRPVAGVYAGSDFGVLAAAEAHAALGIPGCDPEIARRALDKSLALRVWREAGVPVAAGATVCNTEELAAAAADLGLPVVVKPVDSSGSRGVVRVDTESELVSGLAEAQRFSEQVIVEELLLGRHIDLNGLMVEGRFIRCGIMERFFQPPPMSALSLWGAQPAELSSAQEDDCYAIAEHAAQALGIEQGPVKADLIVTADGPRLLELSPRFHGDVLTSYMTPFAQVGSPIGAYFAGLLSEQWSSVDCDTSVKAHAGWRALFASEAGTLARVEGEAEALAISGVYKLSIRVDLGSMIRIPRDNRDICGFVWVVGPSRDEVRARLEEAAGAITFVVD